MGAAQIRLKHLVWKGGKKGSMRRERQSCAEFQMEKTGISLLTVFLSGSILGSITLITKTRVPSVLHRLQSCIGLFLLQADRERLLAVGRPGGTLGNFVALHWTAISFKGLVSINTFNWWDSSAPSCQSYRAHRQSSAAANWRARERLVWSVVTSSFTTSPG